ncbi:MAG: Lyase [Rhodospirillales bacterium]|jgi:catechol 2,3-dioxygenase-like lactoylglutathione lyase family enzyme|nr:Lyase [Rhodospirillales bacterium]
MIDHVSVAVKDLATSVAAYERILAPLHFAPLVERPSTVGFGKSSPEFWLNARPLMTEMPHDCGNHVCLRAPDEAAVNEFYSIALKFGCRSAGEPGIRQAAKTPYFTAFIYDFDGNKIEAAALPRDL